MSRAAREDDDWESYGATFTDKEAALALMRVLQKFNSLFEFRLIGATRFQIERRRK